ncbi:fimbrillin family protein [Bacteroides sp. OttesenSCG-928-D19]|nr:fimbrillin family protein [Bacteroides sp. OttesenSCG-928-N06]MDL2305102.1 fimbrillin family protein [Bacteroides sp. OttesenSCG-928-D19]
MKLKNILLVIVATLVCFACENTTYLPDAEPQDEAVGFLATTKELNTRAGDPFTMSGLHIIAPGYGTGATNQHSIYKSVAGVMEPQTYDDGTPTEDVIRWSAKNMYFTSWRPVNGVVMADDGTGTVDFTNNALEDFIGAYAKDVEYEKPVVPVALEYHHLVAKFTITLKNIVGTISTAASITLPAIKQVGAFKADLKGMPEVSLGKAGDELKFDFTVANDIGTLTCYMPPMTGTQLLMYGSFTIKVGGTTYVGTLNNLGVSEVKAGDHLTFEILINDDHTALLQAVTLAPWEVNSKNIYNRPCDGIWGMEDLQALSKFINDGVTVDDETTEWNNLKMKDLVDDKGIIGLYTNIDFTEDDEFAPIGTDAHPFTGYTFEGNGYTISGISLKNSNNSNQGVFGVVGDNTTIRNLTVKNTLVEGSSNIGILVGKTIGTDVLIDHCFTSGGEVMGNTNVGGLIGHCAANTVIRNCGVTTSSISGSAQVGGLVGFNDGTIGNSYAITGSIICYRVGGGLVGTNNAVMRNCYSSAAFSYGTKNCGASAGVNTEGKEMTYCHWNTECINNTSCSKVVGNSTEDGDGLEKKPSGFGGGAAFNKSNGHFIQNGYSPLHDRLNDYINTNAAKEEEKAKVEGFLRWAKIHGVNLPVFGY